MAGYTQVTEMLEEADGLFEQAKGILANPESTAEEKGHVEELMEDAKAKKREALQMKEILDQAKEIAKEYSVNKPPETSQGEFKDWTDYLTAVWMKQARNVDDERLTWFKDRGESKAMSGATGASGGFLVPTQFIPQLQAVQAEDGIVRSAGPTVIRMDSRQVSLPVLDQTGTTAGVPHWFGGMKFYWEEEGAEKTDTEPEFRRISLLAKKLIGYAYASDEILDDSAISLADFLSGPLGMAGGISWMEDYAFLRGVGGGQPLGILNSPATIAYDRAASGTIGFPDLVEMVERFLPSGRGQWVMTHSALAQIVQMTGPSGNPSYIWQPNAREGVPGSILGMPVRWTEKLPAYGDRGDVLLMDARYYVIGDRQATTVETTPYDRWRYDQTSWRAVHRVDGQPWLSAPLTYQDGSTQVSPFVVLDLPTGS
ncbi:MAG: phage major capsid protein [Candidatus Altiarchaeales archaeon]|nr:phage major capsid protein [Candidatus Altiarchaeales archaeon]